MAAVCFSTARLVGQKNTNARDACSSSTASLYHFTGAGGLFTFHTDQHTRRSRLWWVGWAQPPFTGITRTHMRAVNASLSLLLLIFFITYVFTKAHSFFVTEHTQPVKTIRATGLENVQEAPWDVKAIPDNTGSGLLRISTSWRPDTDNY